MKYTTALLAALLLGLPGLGPAADAEQLAAGCDSCHGPNGVSRDSDVPTIAGQPKPLIQKALQQFSIMERPCSRSAYRHGDTSRPHTSMCRVSVELQESDIAALSEFYAAQKFVAADQPFDEALAVEGAAAHSLYCESCHPKGGSEVGYAGHLAGQWVPYLEKTIGQIRNGDLYVPHMMERKLGDFSDEEIDALLNFWASQGK